MYIEKFLGKRVEIPEDRKYGARQGLWARLEDGVIVLGLSEPALVLIGGLNDLQWIVSEGDRVRPGDTVAVAITQKLLYLDTPLGGTIHFNEALAENLRWVAESPYERGWLFKIRPDSDPQEALGSLGEAKDYIEVLKHTEGFKNPDGVHGGVSPICKAVYLSIREQKFEA